MLMKPFSITFQTEAKNDTCGTVEFSVLGTVHFLCDAVGWWVCLFVCLSVYLLS